MFECFVLDSGLKSTLDEVVANICQHCTCNIDELRAAYKVFNELNHSSVLYNQLLRFLRRNKKHGFQYNFEVNGSLK